MESPPPVLDAVDDVAQPAALIKHRRVDGAPIPNFERPTLGLRATDVVLLNSHRVCDQVCAHTVERRAQVAFAGGFRIVRIVGKNFEQRVSNNVIALGHGRGKIGVAHSKDR